MPRGWCSEVRKWLVAACACWFALSVQAQAPAPGVQRIHVLVAGEDREREAFARVLLELMQRLSVEVELERVERVELAAVVAAVPREPQLLARCFVDLASETRATLYVHDPARDRILERHAPRAPGDDELVREQLGHMLLASVEALLAGIEVGAPRSSVAAAAAPAAVAAPAAHASEPEPAAPVEPAHAAWQLRAALLYELSALGSEPGLAHGPELALAIRSPLSRQLGGLLSAQYRWPIEVDGDAIGMRMHAVALRALATFEQPLGASTVLRFGLGAGADVTRVAPRAAGGTPIELGVARTLTLGVTRALVGAELRITRWLALWGALAADADLDRTQYVLVRSSGQDAQVSAPWRVRPAISLGLVLP